MNKKVMNPRINIILKKTSILQDNLINWKFLIKVIHSDENIHRWSYISFMGGWFSRRRFAKVSVMQVICITLILYSLSLYFLPFFDNGLELNLFLF